MEQERPSTTFHQDFAIAEAFGLGAVRSTYNRVKKEWKDDYRMFTELVIVLNHRLWFHYQNGREELARLYNRLWEDADGYACNNYVGEAAEHFFRVTD